MGVYSKDQVPPMQIIVPSDDEFSRFDLPRQGVTVSGTVKTVTIDDIIAAEGPRLPTMDDAQKEFRFAFIYLVPPGTEISERSVADINRFRKGFVDRFAIFTGGVVGMGQASHKDNASFLAKALHSNSHTGRRAAIDHHSAVFFDHGTC